MKLPSTRSEAKQLGLYQYHTGKACVRGHVANRYVSSGSCIECVRARYIPKPYTPPPKPQPIQIKSIPNNWNANGGNPDLERSYRIIDFGGGSKGARRYHRVRRAIECGVVFLKDAGNRSEAKLLASWAKGSGGFTRPHTPYYIHVDGSVERIFTAALRAADMSAYQLCLKCGSEWHIVEKDPEQVCPHGYLNWKRCRDCT